MIFVDQSLLATVMIEVVAENVLTSSLIADPEADIIMLHEISAGAKESLWVACQRPQMKKLLEKRIQELRDAEDKAEGGEPPYPNVSDIPF